MRTRRKGQGDPRDVGFADYNKRMQIRVMRKPELATLKAADDQKPIGRRGQTKPEEIMFGEYRKEICGDVG